MLCNLWVNVDPHFDHFTMMTIRGLLPKTHALHIPFVSSFGPSSFDGSGDISGGDAVDLLFVGFDYMVSLYFELFVVLCLYFVLGVELLLLLLLLFLLSPYFSFSDFVLGFL